MSADPDSLRHMLEKTEHQLTEHQLADLSLCEMPSQRTDMDDNRGIQRLDRQTADSMTDEGGTSATTKSLKEMRDEVEQDKHDLLLPKLDTPSWLSNALMRQQPQGSISEGAGPVSAKWCSSCGASGTHCLCRNNTSPSLTNHPYTDWLSAVPMAATHPEDNSSAEIPGREQQRVNLGLHMEGSGTGNEAPRPRNGSSGGGGDRAHQREESSMPGFSAQQEAMPGLSAQQEARLKARMLSHPLFTQMLQAHVGCLRIATPVDQLHQIDEQLSQSQNVFDKYAPFTPEPGEEEENKQALDQFMRDYTMILLNFQDQLQNHLRVHATEAMMAYRDLEQKLYELTGATPGPENGLTMSDDEDEQAAETDGGGYETGLDALDSTGGFGPLVPTETERSLKKRARQELKLELNEASRRRLHASKDQHSRKPSPLRNASSSKKHTRG